MHNRLKILLVENERLIYRDLTRFFEENGDAVLRHPTKEIVDNYDDALALVETNIPHLAVLDIQIEGKKNGLELGKYITDHYWIPIVLLTWNNTDENERLAGYINAGAFVVKSGKPVEKMQLKADINRLRQTAVHLAKQKTIGDFFSVSRFYPGTSKKDETQIRRKMEWEQIAYITTENARKNNVLIHLTDGTQWLLHEPLTGVEKRLAPYLVRFNKCQIVNIKQIDRSSKSEFTYYMKEKTFEVSPPYRDEAVALIRLFYSSF